MKRLKVELRVWTTCFVHVSEKPDEDGLYEVHRIEVPMIEGMTQGMDVAALSEDEFDAINEAAATTEGDES